MSITNKQIEEITNLVYKELNIPQDDTTWTREHYIKSKLMNETLTLVMAGTFMTLDGMKTIEIIRTTLNGLELILIENRK